MTVTPTAHAGARQDSTPEQAAPDRIWAWTYNDPWGNELRWFNSSEGFTPEGNEVEYIRADLAAPSAPAEVEGLVICDGCGCTTTDAELADMRGERSSLISCCPERKMRPATRDDWDKQRAALTAQQAEIERLQRENLEVLKDYRAENKRREKAEAAVEELAEACRQAKIQSRRAFNITENFHAVLGAVATAVDPALAAHAKLKGDV